MGYPPGAPESFFVSAEEPRGHVEDDIECGEVITCSRGSAGPEPSKYCLVWLLYNSKVSSVLLDGYKHS